MNRRGQDRYGAVGRWATTVIVQITPTVIRGASKDGRGKHGKIQKKHRDFLLSGLPGLDRFAARGPRNGQRIDF